MAKHSRKKRYKLNGGRLFLGLIAVILIFAVIALVSSCSGGKNDSNGLSSLLSVPLSANDNSSLINNSTSSTASTSSNTISSEKPIETSSGNLTDTSVEYNLILVNSKNLLPKNYSPSVQKITEKYVSPVGLKFDSRAVSKLNQLLEDANNAGLNLIVISSYRSMSRQIELYDAEVEKQKNLHPNYTDEEAKAAAGKNVAIPGTSEHQLGLAVDFNTVVTNFENSDEYKWLKEHAADYGFVNRYPKDKVSITGINYEPWHWRYVGETHAKKINELGFCLEEYIEYLK